MAERSPVMRNAPCTPLIRVVVRSLLALTETFRGARMVTSTHPR